MAYRLDRDIDFRRRFLDEIAPLAESVLLGEGDDLKATIWAYLQEDMPRYRDLFKLQGAVAVELLTTPEYRPFYDKIAEAIRFGDNRTIEALRDKDLRGREVFLKLLGRALPSRTLTKALANLHDSPHDAARLLSYYDRLSDSALIADLDPPPDGWITWVPLYSIYSLGDKYWAGRDISIGDVLNAIDDVMFIKKIIDKPTTKMSTKILTR